MVNTSKNRCFNIFNILIGCTNRIDANSPPISDANHAHSSRDGS